MAELPVIPQNITVHLGRPNENARNVTIPFATYIKNVASSEIYPTWPENAIRANIYAQTSFALNRIYTEHYRSRGYNFDITNSTAYDQAYVDGRDIFSNISRLVDELFDNYVTKGTQIQPYFTQYCSGRGVTCDGLSQWGTVTLANQGYTPYRMLQYYYGNDVNIKTAPVRNVQESYPGRALRVGSVGENTRIIQRQLNRIAQNYPAIPRIPNPNGVFDSATREAVKTFQRIFNLTVDGIVGKATWYRIKQIYSGILRLGELYSEGLQYSDVERQFKTVIRQGDRGLDVALIQYYLNFIGNYNRNVSVPEVDRIFGPATYNSVLSFQRAYGLAQDGIVGRDTWNALQNVYNSILNSFPGEFAVYEQYRNLFYPGYNLVNGSTGSAVRQLQEFLRVLSRRASSVPLITADGIYGARTGEAVNAAQRYFGLPVVPYVGQALWNALAENYYYNS
ncbi:MAG: peptidoglycan-binding protein [Clostridia bacterium]|nr:peptidoglycan-binding protein [Clostridia bacterium]